MNPYAISRMQGRSGAWYWRVHFRRAGMLHEKTFPDLRRGGKKVAFAAAIAWRDASLKKIEVFTKRDFHAQKRSNNTSGVPGVHLAKSAAQPLGAWQAKIKLPDGRKITKGFSVLKFGDKAAFRLAVAARQRMLELIDDQPYLKNPVARKAAALTAPRKPHA